MATKRDRTAFAVSNNLKTAMTAAGYAFPIQPGQAFYDGGSKRPAPCARTKRRR